MVVAVYVTGLNTKAWIMSLSEGRGFNLKLETFMNWTGHKLKISFTSGYQEINSPMFIFMFTLYYKIKNYFH